jgi:heme-degrading monooxygenase HmoA
MIHELRIYEIFDHNKDAFHARFRDHAARLMRDHGFSIVAMWEARGDQGPEFVYLLAWSDEAARESAWRHFMADAEWQRIKRETAEESGDLVGRITTRVLTPTGYSPKLAA